MKAKKSKSRKTSATKGGKKKKLQFIKVNIQSWIWIN